MLEERKARLLPEAMPEEQRGIDSSGQRWSSNQLRKIIKGNELFRADLKMNLEAGVAGLHHHVVVRDLQLVNALDVDVESASAQGADGAVQFVVAGDGREIVYGEIGYL